MHRAEDQPHTDTAGRIAPQSPTSVLADLSGDSPRGRSELFRKAMTPPNHPQPILPPSPSPHATSRGATWRRSRRPGPGSLRSKPSCCSGPPRRACGMRGGRDRPQTPKHTRSFQPSISVDLFSYCSRLPKPVREKQLQRFL